MLIKFVLIGIGMVLGDIFMKNWSNYSYDLRGVGLIYLIVALLFYSVSLTYYGLQLRSTNFSIATILPIVINILIVLLITVFYYHEPLSAKQWLGVLLGFCAILLLR
jgi:drug/metabolite transporter (DMT)-like permease